MYCYLFEVEAHIFFLTLTALHRHVDRRLVDLRRRRQLAIRLQAARFVGRVFMNDICFFHFEFAQTDEYYVTL